MTSIIYWTKSLLLGIQVVSSLLILPVILEGTSFYITVKDKFLEAELLFKSRNIFKFLVYTSKCLSEKLHQIHSTNSGGLCLFPWLSRPEHYYTFWYQYLPIWGVKNGILGIILSGISLTKTNTAWSHLYRESGKKRYFIFALICISYSFFSYNWQLYFLWKLPVRVFAHFSTRIVIVSWVDYISFIY